MLDGSALLRVFLVVIAAAVLTGIVQHYWSFDSSQPETPLVAARPAAPARRPDPAPPRTPAREAAAPQAAMPVPEPPPPTAPPLAAEPETRSATPEPAPEPAAPPAAAIPPAPAPRPPPPPVPAVAPTDEPAQSEVASAETADPRALDLVDLNTGSLAELNGLKGGGAIGRAIIQHRPYSSTDQLLSKRVLSRALYQRIKAQVTIR